MGNSIGNGVGEKRVKSMNVMRKKRKGYLCEYVCATMRKNNSQTGVYCAYIFVRHWEWLLVHTDATKTVFKTSDLLTKNLGIRNMSRDINSMRLFCNGVPVNNNLRIDCKRMKCTCTRWSIGYSSNNYNCNNNSKIII